MSPLPLVPRVLFVDHDDSFTYNLVHLLTQAGARVTVHSAREPVPEVAAFDAVVVGPGHGRPDETARWLEALLERRSSLPILGVCLGHQAIAVWAGGRVMRSPSPVHGERAVIQHAGTKLFSAIPSPFYCARYNSLTVCPDHLPETLQVTATSVSGEVMALQHRTRPIRGIQFHPESVLSDFGCQILRNWLEDL